MNQAIIDTETTSVDPHSAKLLGVGVYTNDEIVYTTDVAMAKLYVQDKPLIGHNIKYDLVVLARHGLFTTPFLGRAVFDTMVALYLLEIDKPRKLEVAYERYTGDPKKDLLDVYNESGVENRIRKNLPADWYDKIPHAMLSRYCKEDIFATSVLHKFLMPKLIAQPKLAEWFYKVEMPLVNVLTAMELKGCKIDKEKMISMRESLLSRMQDLENRLKNLAGYELNLNSPKQLSELLFDKFKLRKIKRSKTSGNLSTDIHVLKKLASSHAFPKLLLEYRETEKLLVTYVLPLLEKIDSNNRIHTQYNQALTRTRRFSSENPNLQNIPSRSKLGQEVKACFIPDEGHKFLIADYSQIELRILAHASDDPTLIDAFKTGKDLHQITADALKIDRRQAKIINFAIVYGISAVGLSQQLNVSCEEAQNLIDKFLATYSGIKSYMVKQRTLAQRNKGFVYSYPAELPLYVGDLTTQSKSEYESAMRGAINYPIQCGSQDILKQAIIKIYDDMKHIPVLMVHDELVFELPKDYESKQIVDIMETVVELKVPITVGWKESDRWEK